MQFRLDPAETTVQPRVMGTLIALTIARVAFGYQVQTVASLGPTLVGSMGIAFALLGTLMGLYMLPGVVAAVPYGFLGRRFGERGVAAFGFACMTLGSLLSATATGPAILGLGRVVAGLGAVSLTVLQGKIVSDRFSGKQFTLAIGLLLGGFPVGIGFAQLTQTRLADEFDWPAAFVAGAAISAAAFVLLLATWQEPRGDRIRTLRWPSRHECGLVIVSGLIWAFYNAGYFNFLAFMPSFMAAHGHSRAQTDLVLAIATWGNAPSILVGSALAVRIGNARVFMLSSVLGTIAVAGTYFADVPLLWGTMFGTVASLHAGVIVGLGTLSARPENRAVGMALFYTTYYLGGFVFPPICGKAADLAGDPAAAFLCAAFLAAMAVPFFFLHRHLANRPGAAAA